ncbi:MAG: ABC transporter permease [Holosporales bacterium]|jgi:ABC-2 type transport system permease protein|nr:ABC transporter permease [Holosporales bacterium]
MLYGVRSLIIKEMHDMLREPKSAGMIFAPIIIFLTLFVFATTKDVENTSIVVLNNDAGVHSTNILERIVSTNTFKDTYYVHNQKDFNKCINTEKAFIGIIFPESFSKNIYSGGKTDIQIVTDGRRTNSAVIAQGYILKMISNNKVSGVNMRTWYNPNKDPVWFSVTNLICMLIASQAISIVALAIAREKEVGTFDQLLVTPISPFGILLGKIMPGIMISMFMGFFVMFFAHYVYSVPIRGSILLMFISMLVYVIAVVGVGVLVSAFANTQQQASLGMFVLLLPIMSLSGIASPVEGITNSFFRLFAKCNPIVYANRLVKGIMIKNMTLHDAWLNIYPLLIISFVLLSVSSIVFVRTHKIKII